MGLCLKKTRFWLISFLLVMAALFGVAAAACTETPETPENPTAEGPESGVYYYDGDGDEYLITLNSGNQFAFLVRDENRSGTYTLADTALTFSFYGEESETLTASLSNDVITLTYDGSEMRFLKRIPYTVSFDSTGGSAVESVTVINGKTLEKPADPSRGSSVFIGWYLDAEYSDAFAFGTDIVTSDLTLYARWADRTPGQTEYTIRFDACYEGAEAIDSMQTIGGILYNAPTPTREGYTFGGWWVSMYGNADQLAYRWTEDMVFTEGMTLYALWTEEGASELAAPVVNVGSGLISWAADPNATAYQIEISGPEDFTMIRVNLGGQTSYAFDFASQPAGDYEIRVTATGMISTDRVSAYRYYKNKALSRVSNFSVVEPSTLIYEGVANAERYYITIECGNEEHRHTMLDNGTSTYYNFANCTMQEGGIRFVVTAVADGYAASTSETFVFERVLGTVTTLYYDSESESVMWDPVPNAASYRVTVTAGGNTTTATVSGATSYSLKGYGAGELLITVCPVTSGYNSPAATELTCTKVSLATPDNFRVQGTLVSWDAVEGATSYEISLGGATYTVSEPGFDLSTANMSWTEGSDYMLNVRAIGASASSPWSDDVDMRYAALYSTLLYSESILSWRHVIGAEYYEVRVNNNAVNAIRVEDGLNYTEIKLTRAGVNTLSVRFYAESGYSDWAEIEVYAYTVTFDSRSGAGVEPVYLAIGDRVALPESSYTGYTFTGWYTVPGAAGSNGAQYSDELFAGGDMVLYANWRANVYTITYDLGDIGDVNSINAQASVTYRESYLLESPTVRDGQEEYGFVGWFTAPGGGGIQLTNAEGNSLNVWNYAEDLTVYAYWASAFSYTYNATTDSYTVSKGEGIPLMSEVTIPETHDDGEHGTRYVTAVSDFTGLNNLIIINMYDWVTRIDISAFTSTTNLEEINILHAEANNEPVYFSVDGVVIYYTAPGAGEEGTDSDIHDYDYGNYQLYLFPRGKGGYYTIPNMVTELRAEVFMNNTNLLSVTVPASVEYIASNTFANCSSITNIVFESDPNATGLEIAENAFDSCSGLTSITLPAQLTVFSAATFASCSNLTEINIASGSPNYFSNDGVVFELVGAEEVLIYFPVARDGSYTVPNSTTEIGANAFADSAVEEIYIPASVAMIHTGAFSNTDDLDRVVFTSPLEGQVAEPIYLEDAPAGTTSDDYSQGVFYSSGVSEIVYETGRSLGYIGNHAFRSCSSLTGELVIPATVEYIGMSAFYGTRYSTIRFAAPAEGETAAELRIADASSTTSGAFYSMSSLTTIIFEEGSNVVEIGNYAFYSRSSLTGTLTIPATVRRIGYGAFYNAGIDALVFAAPAEGQTAEELVIQGGTSTSSGAFYSADMTSVTFETGSNVVEIGNYAFYSCIGLTSFTFPESVRVVGSYVLRSCSYLTEVTFTTNQTTYGDLMFDGCTRLTTAYIGANAYNLGSSVFAGADNLEEVIVHPDNTHYTTDDATGALYEINSDGDPIGLLFFPAEYTGAYVTPETLRVIGSAIFRGKGITSVVIGRNVVEIGTEAFYNCVGLTSLTFESGRTEPLTIGTSAFANCAITSLEIPATVSYIGPGAFYNNAGLTSLTFEESAGEEVSLVIDSGSGSATGAFAYTSIVTLNLPDRLTRIGNYAFYRCEELTSVYIPANVANEAYVNGQAQNLGIGNYAFAYCYALTNVDFASGGTGELTIGQYAFSNTRNLTTLTLPDRLAEARNASGATLYALGGYTNNYVYYMFGTSTSNAGIASLNIENGGSGAYTSYNGIVYYNNEVLFVPYHMTEATIAGSATGIVNRYAFYYADDLEVLNFEESDVPFEIPDGVTSSGTASSSYGIFYGSTVSSLTTINFPARLTRIGEYAFYNNSVIETITFAEGSNLVEIAEAAFYSVDDLTSITLPGSLETIAQRAFYATGLESITFEAGSGTLEIADSTSSTYGAFGNNDSLVSVTFGSSVVSIGNYAFYDCDALATVNFPDSGLEAIGESAFAYCALLTNVDFASADFESIGEYAFRATGLTEVVLPESIRSLSDNIFAECESLVRVVLHDNLAEDFSFTAVFPDCPAISVIDVPENSTRFSSIDGVLYNANATTLMSYPVGKLDESYTIPEGVLTIDANAFAYNEHLRAITMPRTLTAIEEAAFRGCTALETVNFAANGNLTEIGNGAFAECDAIESITIPASVLTIAPAAFAFCDSLREVNFAASTMPLTLADGDSYSTSSSYVLDNGAFARNESLTTVNFNNRIVVIGAYAFSYCTALTSINLPATITQIGDQAFRSSALAEINLSNVTSLGDYALAYTNVVSLDLSSMTEFGSYAIAYNYSLTTITGYPEGLAVLPDRLFYYCSALSDVIIPSSVTEIGSYTFANCSSLTSITIPSSVTTIGSYAFAYSGLTSVVIPASVTEMEQDVFYQCRSLTSAEFESGSTLSELPTYTFYQCYVLSDVVLPQSITSIESFAFAYCSALTSIDLPNSVTSLGASAFRYSGLRSIDLNNVNSLGTYALANTSISSIDLSNVNLGSSSTFGNYAIANNVMLTNVTLPANLTSIPNFLFDGCSSFSSFTIPASVTSIGTFAFRNTGLASIVIPATVTSIGNNAFYGTERMSSVTFESGENAADLTLGTNVFAYSGLTSIVLPARLTITSISRSTYMFNHAERLQTVSFEEGSGVTAFPNYMFQYTESLQSVIFPEGLTAIGNSVFRYSGITSIDVPDTVASFGTYVFANCDYLTTVTLPDGLTSLGSYAFRSSAIESITLPSALTSIPTYAFYETALTSISIPASVTSIGTYAFQYCTELRSVTFEADATTGTASVTSIGTNAFADSGLESIVIPKTVTTLSSGAFLRCANLSSVVFEANGTANLTTASGTTSTGVFGETPALESIVLPARLTSIGSYTFRDSAVRNVTFEAGSTLATINACAFLNCTALESITIPASVTRIYAGVFHNCSALEEAVFEEPAAGTAASDLTLSAGSSNTSTSPASSGIFSDCFSLERVVLSNRATSIPAYMFYNCTSLTDYNIPASATSIGNYAFSYCPGPDTLTIPGTVYSFGNYAFQYGSYRTLILEEGVTTGGYMAFSRNENLTTVTIPASLESVADYNPFIYDINLRTINVAASSTHFSSESTPEYAVLYNADRTTLVGFTGTGNFTVPASVTRIGLQGFGGSEVESVTFANPTTELSFGSFFGCANIRTITLPTGMTEIPEALFLQCYSLEEIILPSTLQVIGYRAFHSCTALESITIPGSVTQIDRTAFYNCTALREVIFEESTTPLEIRSTAYDTTTSTTEIVGAFQGCTALTSITLPERLTYIGGYTFYGSGLVSITIPASVEVIGRRAFSECADLEEVIFEAGSPITMFGTPYSSTYTRPESRTSDSRIFENCVSLRRVVLPEALEIIRPYDFAGCTSLESLDIPESVTAIGGYAFQNSGLRSFTFTANMTEVRGYVFDGSALESVTVAEDYPETYLGYRSTYSTTTKSMATYLFRNCTSLREVTLPAHFDRISAGTFQGCTSLYTIEMPESLLYLYGYAFQDSGIEEIELPEGFIWMGAYVFDGCELLESVSLPSTLTRIGTSSYSVSTVTGSGYTFRDCTSLRSIRLPEGLQYMASGTFSNSGLRNITLPATLVSVGRGLFTDCARLTTVTIQAMLSDMSYTDGSTLDAPTSETAVDNRGMFANCTALTSVTFPDHETAIPEYMFAGCTSLESIDLPSSIVEIGEYAFYGAGLTSFNLSHIADIGSYAFANCTLINSLYIPENVRSLGEGVFSGWTDMQEIRIGHAEAPGGWDTLWNLDCSAIIVWNA